MGTRVSEQEEAEDRSVDELIRDLRQGVGIPSVPAVPRTYREDGSCRLVVHFFGGRSESWYPSVRDAVERAFSLLREGQAWPVLIDSGGEVLWELEESRDNERDLEQWLHHLRASAPPKDG